MRSHSCNALRAAGEHVRRRARRTRGRGTGAADRAADRQALLAPPTRDRSARAARRRRCRRRRAHGSPTAPSSTLQRGAGHRDLVRGNDRHARRLAPAVGRQQHADERAVGHARPQRRARLARLAQCASASPCAKPHADAVNGTAAIARPASSASTHSVTASSPLPPCASGTAVPSQPRSARRCHSARRTRRPSPSRLHRAADLGDALASALRNSIRIAC